jgi:hypothetical protein
MSYGSGGPDRLDLVDTGTFSVHAALPLEPGLGHRGLVVGARTGRVYLFGNRTEPDGVSAWLIVLDPTGHRVGSWQLYPAEGRHWVVYAGAVSPDERHAVVSYHGEDTSGADVLGWTSGAWAACPPTAADRSDGCVADIHGRVVPTAAGFVAATGDPATMLRVDYRGAVVGRWNPELPGNHLMEFDLDPAQTAAYPVGSCGYAGGLSRIDLRRGRVRVLVPPAAPGAGIGGAARVGVCGEAVAASGDLLAVARRERPVPQRKPGAILLVDPATGRVLHTTATSAEPVDLVIWQGG